MTIEPDSTELLPTIGITTDLAAALDAARPNATQIDVAAPSSVVALTRRDDVVVEIVDLEAHQPTPTRQSGIIRALNADGFIRTVQRLEVQGIQEAVVYADADACQLVAILNDDTAGVPGWRDMRVGFEPQATPEWSHWINNQGLVEQAKFAKALEDGETEIRTPSATVMLDLAQTFNASTTAKFKQAGRLKDGRTQLVYEEEIDATAGEGIAAVPDSFTIEVRPFYGAEPVTVECRLRYRIDRGDLRIGYTIHRPEEIRRTSFAVDVVGKVEAAGLAVLDAVPALAR